MSELILSLNAGSSSLKFGLYRRDGGELVETMRGLAEGLGGQARLSVRDAGGETLLKECWSAAGDAPEHASALARVLAWLDGQTEGEPIAIVAHRIVHGGDHASAEVFSLELEAELQALAPLAPLHQPVGLALYRQARARLPAATHVACFDTAFHSRMPETARRFALPRELTAQGVRRYGFHGLSYAHTLRRLGSVDPDLAACRLVAAHLGAGASLCALEHETSQDTTMGFSALDGLMMATRCGSLDPGVVLHLLKRNKMSPGEVEDLLYRRSGLLGVSGLSGDLRELMAADSEDAKAAVDLFVYRTVQGIGAMAATLGGMDGLVFTGGVGEHNAEGRARICRRLAWLGVDIDPRANAGAGERRIDAPTSCVSVWVIPANEEAEMAHEAADLVWPRARPNDPPSSGPSGDRVDALLDEALEETFPASDPPSLVRPHDPDDLEPASAADRE